MQYTHFINFSSKAYGLFVLLLCFPAISWSSDSLFEQTSKTKTFEIYADNNTQQPVDATLIARAFASGQNIRLSNVAIQGDLILKGINKNTVKIDNSSFNGVLSITNSEVTALSISYSTIQGSFIIRQNKHLDELKLVHLKVKGAFDIVQSKVAQLTIRESEFSNDLVFDRTNILNKFIIYQSIIHKGLRLKQIQSEANLEISNVQAKDEIILSRSTINGFTTFKSVSTDKLIISDSQLSQQLLLMDLVAKQIYLFKNQHQAQLAIKRATITQDAGISFDYPFGFPLIIEGGQFLGGIAISKMAQNNIGIEQLRIQGANVKAVLELNGIDFDKDIHFSDVQLEHLSVNNITTLGSLLLNKVTIGGQTHFNQVKLFDKLEITQSIFKMRILFENFHSASVTLQNNDFLANLFAPWYSLADNQGLRNTLQYEKQVFGYLVKNYNELGMTKEADDVFYTGKLAELKNMSPVEQTLNNLFLRYPFGYGVKPNNLIWTFTCVVVAYALVYWLILLRISIKPKIVVKDQYPNPQDIITARLEQLVSKQSLKHLLWCFHHSLNQVSPGIDLNSQSLLAMNSTIDANSLATKTFVYIENSEKMIGWYLLLLLVVMFGRLGIR